MRNSIRAAYLITLLGVVWFEDRQVYAQQFNYVYSDGCAHVFLYGWNEGRDDVIVVRADREKLGLQVGTNKLSVSSASKDLEVYVDIYAKSQPKVDYCTDVRSPDQDRPLASLHADAGQLEITLGKQGTLKGKAPFMYEASVTLRDLSFKDSNGSVVIMKSPVTLKAVVGYVWG